MSAIEFRIIVALFAVLLLAHVSYRAPRSAELHAAEDAAQFGWIRALPRARRALVAVSLISVLACGLIGLVGMFFFSKAAAILFFVAVLTVEVGGQLVFGGVSKSPLEWALRVLTTLGSLLLVYLAFFGPAKELFG